MQAGCEWLVWACCDRRPPSTLWGFAPKGILLAVHAIAARMAAQRGLGLFRAAEESSRSTVEAGQPPCASACALEALPSSQTAEQPASREAAVQDEQLPRAVSATGFGGNTRTKKRIFEKRLRVRRAHPWATPPCKRLILGALRGSVGAIHQYLWNGGSFAEFAEGGESTNES